MRRKDRFTLALLLVATLLSVVSVSIARDTRAEVAFRPGNLIRLHVIANSDSDEDQSIKLEVRDAVLLAMEARLDDKVDADEAYTYLLDNEWIVRRAIEDVISTIRPAMPYNVEFGEFDFPDRAYGDRLVPAGRYRALRIILGGGQGRNWWCVLFPPLCFKDLTQSTGPDPAQKQESSSLQVVDESQLQKIKVEYRLKLIEWARAQRDETKQLTAQELSKMQ